MVTCYGAATSVRNMLSCMALCLRISTTCRVPRAEAVKPQLWVHMLALLQAEARAAAEQSAGSAKLRHAGNKAFQRGRVEEAVRLYSEVRLPSTDMRRDSVARAADFPVGWFYTHLVP